MIGSPPSSAAPRSAALRALSVGALVGALVASCSAAKTPPDGGDALVEAAQEAASSAPDGSDAASCVPSAPARCCVNADCPSRTPVCDGHTCVGRALGQACATSDECAGGTCADGVCCDGACTTTCSSCRETDTGKRDGTCAPVLMNGMHGHDCAPTQASTCGTTGACDGAGGCLDWPAGTRCGPATCAARTSLETPAPACDGKGACVPAASKSCETYACSAATLSCRTACATSVDCASGFFCTSGACAKRPLGQVCRGSDECASGSCGGRCCPSGPVCLCPQPSPQNLIVNPGFDTGLDGWTIDLPPRAVDGGPSPQKVRWVAADDADGCPYSGSIEVDYDQGDGAPPPPPAISQCVPIKAGTGYNVGARMAGDGYCSVITCSLDFYAGDGCTGDDTPGSTALSVSNGPWDPYQAFSTPSDAPLDARSVRVTCTLEPPFNRTACTARFDAVFVSPDPFSY